MNFKVGDKVKRIKPSAWPDEFGHMNKEYVVLALRKDNKGIKIIENADFAKPIYFQLVADYNTYKMRHEEFNCTHDWFDYLGLNESFTFCKKCDVKK